MALDRRLVHDAITDVGGIEVGHAEDLNALTGCTVVLCREGGVVGVDVRGLAPGTRETDLCRPGTLVERAHAILLAGGSAFGLNAASGVMRFLWERGLGFDVGITTVPIVPGAVLFDLALGQIAWPDDATGYEACARAAGGAVDQGCVGAGTGASVGKLLGPLQATKSGIGTASTRVGDVVVGALFAVNAFGNVIDSDSGEVLAGARDPATGAFVDAETAMRQRLAGAVSGPTNTTIGVVATDATLNSDQVNHLARVAHDGLARTVRPVHTLLDGDTIFALTTGGSPRDVADPNGWQAFLLGLDAATVRVVERAVVKAVEAATPAGGLPAMRPEG